MSPPETNPGTIYHTETNIDAFDPYTYPLPSEIDAPEPSPALEKHLTAIDRWRQEVSKITRETAALRAHLQAELEESIAEGYLDAAAAAIRRDQIEQDVARGACRIFRYNRSVDPSYNRSQLYYVTVDEVGNIWGDYEERRPEPGITGRPIAPGRHLIRRNPTL